MINHDTVSEPEFPSILIYCNFKKKMKYDLSGGCLWIVMEMMILPDLKGNLNIS